MFRTWTEAWLTPEFRQWNIEEYLLVLESCGHSPHSDRPDKVLNAASRFVRQTLDLGR